MPNGDIAAPGQNGGLLKELAKQIPSLVVLAVLTYLFLGHMADSQEAHAGVLEDIGIDCHGFSEDREEVLVGVVEANTEALLENTRTLGVLAEVVREHSR
jgi:hypothetical protein